MGMLELPMTEPNSLFSNMMMTICSKFGINSFGVGVGEGPKVGRRVGKSVCEGKGVIVATGSGTVGGTLGVFPHDWMKSKRNINVKTNRVFTNYLPA